MRRSTAGASSEAEPGEVRTRALRDRERPVEVHRVHVLLDDRVPRVADVRHPVAEGLEVDGAERRLDEHTFGDCGRERETIASDLVAEPRVDALQMQVGNA